MGQTKKHFHKLGIMGGSFDPIHKGHLKVAELSMNNFGLNEVVFVTAYCPPHKSMEDLAPPEHRFAMVKLAVKDNPFFKSSEIEMEMGCIAYAGDTIKAFKEMCRKDCEIYFITGLDALLTIINWDKARTYPGLCQFIAAARPGFDRKKIEREIPESFKPYINILEEPDLSISSTEIRSRVKSNQPVDNLVPKSIKEYILKYSLYNDFDSKSSNGICKA